MARAVTLNKPVFHLRPLAYSIARFLDAMGRCRVDPITGGESWLMVR